MTARQSSRLERGFVCSGKRLVVGELGGHHEPTHLQECKFDFQNQKGGN